MNATTVKKARRRVPRRERIEIRVSSEERAMLQHAADLEYRSLAEFIRSSAHDAAGVSIRRHEVITLTAEESAAFVEALMNPPEPNEHLRAAYQAYRERFGR